jgi:hypothetical protein
MDIRSARNYLAEQSGYLTDVFAVRHRQILPWACPMGRGQPG